MSLTPSRCLCVLLGLSLTLSACSEDKTEAPSSTRLFDAAAPEASAPAETLGHVADDAPLVVFLGDSFSAGHGLSVDQAFPAVVQRLLVDEGQPFRLVNAGVSGDTSAGGLRRLNWLLKQNPDILVLELGGNDGLRGQPLRGNESGPGIYDNLRQIIERTEAAGVQVLLLGITMPASHGSSYGTLFARLYQQLADEFELPFVDDFLHEFSINGRYQLADGLHPNPAGHELLAGLMLDELRELLAEIESESH
ncbi:MAG: acyl-CoA thioesterase-1 [Pseudohongiellaceae bacterium]|jgi:acyl-CoA thioesterase-1